MGNCFSDPSKPPGKGQVLGSAPPPPTTSTTNTNSGTQKDTSGSVNGRNNAPPRTLGAGTGMGTGAGVPETGDARERALKAAEERAKTAQKKGVNSNNPKSGQLSSKLAANNASPQQPQTNERMMDRGDWN